MTKRKYHIKKMTQEQLTSLGSKFPNTVEIITIRRPRYSIIAKMLDCALNDMIPEVVLLSEEEAVEQAKKGILAVNEEDEVELKGDSSEESSPRKRLGL